jgi:hypothetical protein
MFGRRIVNPTTPSAPHGFAAAGPDQDGVTRVLPKALWDGPHGDMLRQSGMHPDDPKNLALTPDRARAMEDAATAQMNKIIAKVNAHIPGVTFMPWAMLPWSVWEGLNAEFLIKRDFLPSSPWNNLLLAADQETSERMGLPEHPRAAIAGIHEDVSRLVDELRLEAKDEFDTTAMAIQRGDWSALDRHEDFKTKQFQKLMMLAWYFADCVFGKEVRGRHDELFGQGLHLVTD